jgi:hypothetical protein
VKTKHFIHPRLIVTRYKELRDFVKCRRMYRLSGVSPPLEIKPFNNCIDTLERAVNERVFFVKNREGQFVEPPQPEGSHFAKTVSSFGKRVVRFVGRTVPLSRSAFVETFRGRKLAVYQSAYQSLQWNSVTSKDANIHVFVKSEKTDFTTKLDPVPRVISPRSPRFNIEVGRYLRRIEESLFRAIGKVFGHTTVIKGFNAVDSATLLSEKWGMFVNPAAVGLDASRFDQHVSKPALKFEHSVYVNCFAHSYHRKQLATLLSWQLENNCHGFTPNGKLRYKINGGRMSGDMNTSLGNCLIMCAMIHAYLGEKGITGQLANNGDDCVVFMEKSDVPRFQNGLFEWFEKMGFNMTMENPVYQFEQIEFCQTKPVFDGAKFTMCRNPHTALAKDTVLLQPGTTVDYTLGWIDAVGKGGLSMTGGLPVFQEFYQMYIRSGKEYKGKRLNAGALSWRFRHMIGHLNEKYRDISPETRASFYYAFGITPDAQIELEKVYRNLVTDVRKSSPLIFRHDLCLVA